MKFLAGLLAGSFLGSAVALLLAPRSGRQLRDSIAHEAKRMAVKAASSVDLHEYSEIADEENRRNLVENIAGIRSAGL